MERTHRLLRDPNALTFDRSQMAPTRESEFIDDGSVPLFLSEPDPPHFASSNPIRPTTNLTRIAVVGLAGLTFAIILAAVSYSDVTRVIVDKARSAASGAITDQAAKQAASSKLDSENSVNEVGPATVARGEATASTDHTAPQGPTKAEAKGNERAAPSKALDAETLLSLVTRAKRLLAVGDVVPARLLLDAPPARRTQPARSCWRGPMIRMFSERAIREASHPILLRRATGTARQPALARPTRNSVSRNFRTDLSGGCRA